MLRAKQHACEQMAYGARKVNVARILILLIGFSFGGASVATAQALSPFAREPFQNGLQAVERQQWLAAIRSFTDAQAFAPDDPAIAFNLGLANARAGQELAAIAWLQAYLALSPQAANSAAIWREIRRLDAAAQERIEKLIGILKEVALLRVKLGMSDDNLHRARAAAGDVQGVIKEGRIRAQDAWKERAEALAMAGLINAAHRALEHVNAEDRLSVYSQLLSPGSLSGDGHAPDALFEEAKRFALGLKDARQRAQVVSRLITSQSARRLKPQATDLALAEAHYADLKPGSHRERFLVELLQFLIEGTDQAAPMRFAEKILSDGALPVEEADVIADKLMDAYLRAGRLAQAKRLAAMLERFSPDAWRRARLQAALGNFQPAMDVAARMACQRGERSKDIPHRFAGKRDVLDWVVLGQIAYGDYAAAESTKRELRRECEPNYPEDPAAYVRRGIAHLRIAQGNARAFLDAVREMQQISPDRHFIGAPAVRLFLAGRRTADELNAFEQVLKNATYPPDRAIGFASLANVYGKNGNFKDANRLNHAAAQALLAYVESENKKPPNARQPVPVTREEMLAARRGSQAMGDVQTATALEPHTPAITTVQLAREISSKEWAVDIGSVVKKAIDVVVANPSQSELADAVRNYAEVLYVLRARGSHLPGARE